ncbi:hypothetical protein HOK51_08745 [Candidatus Woesearchaeota archaeon]|jgi:hypothetical protein|nr:hypothetical protein [Candidatus Woesearchaeota archaeon]MBT6519915.1 hypothetical protein [Candidatus Woesearchaeota archaeon]MBT7367109.1 hypothetical protein [Candidatus Woesearchaeota archaeon]
MNIQNIKNKIVQKTKRAVDCGITIGVLTLFGASITIAVNAPLIPIQAGIECLLDEDQITAEGTLMEIKSRTMMQTKGMLYSGVFELDSGETIELYDSSRILEGKYFANSIMLNLEIGEKYVMEFQGSDMLGYVITDTN